MGGGNKLGSDLDIGIWIRIRGNIFRIRIRQNDADPLDLDPTDSNPAVYCKVFANIFKIT